MLLWGAAHAVQAQRLQALPPLLWDFLLQDSELTKQALSIMLPLADPRSLALHAVFQVKMSFNKPRLSATAPRSGANVARSSEVGKAFRIFSKSIHFQVPHTIRHNPCLVTEVRHHRFPPTKTFGVCSHPQQHILA